MAEVTNSVPNRLARVIQAIFAETRTLAPAGRSEAFVAAAEDLEGVTTALELAERLTLVDNEGRLLQGPWAIIEFDVPEAGLASPVISQIPGFIGQGRTAGGAREFVIPNAAVSDLQNVTIRVVR